VGGRLRHSRGMANWNVNLLPLPRDLRSAGSGGCLQGSLVQPNSVLSEPYGRHMGSDARRVSLPQTRSGRLVFFALEGGSSLIDLEGGVEWAPWQGFVAVYATRSRRCERSFQPEVLASTNWLPERGAEEGVEFLR
jgi:hypothetical protein